MQTYNPAALPALILWGLLLILCVCFSSGDPARVWYHQPLVLWWNRQVDQRDWWGESRRWKDDWWDGCLQGWAEEDIIIVEGGENIRLTEVQVLYHKVRLVDYPAIFGLNSGFAVSGSGLTVNRVLLQSRITSEDQIKTCQQSAYWSFRLLEKKVIFIDQ